MINAIISLFRIAVAFFKRGGLFTKVISFFRGRANWLIGGITGIGTLLFGGFKTFGQVWAYIASYHIIEVIRRFFLITFVVSVFGWVINYIVKSLAVYNSKTIPQLFTSFLDAISSYGALGNNLLALLTKVGFFDCLSIFFTVVIYTLISRVALTILFK